jgi:hypothetical protein
LNRPLCQFRRQQIAASPLRVDVGAQILLRRLICDRGGVRVWGILPFGTFHLGALEAKVADDIALR